MGRGAASAGPRPSSFDALLFAASSQLEQAPAGQQTTMQDASKQPEPRPGKAARRPRSPATASHKEPAAAAAAGRGGRKRRSPTPLAEPREAVKQKGSDPRGPPPELLAVPTAATRRCQSLLGSAMAAIREAQELSGGLSMEQCEPSTKQLLVSLARADQLLLPVCSMLDALPSFLLHTCSLGPPKSTAGMLERVNATTGL